MAGSPEGGKKTVATNKAKDPDFYKKIGALGGGAHHPESRPFTTDRELAARAGRVGGLKSRRRKVSPETRKLLSDNMTLIRQIKKWVSRGSKVAQP